MRLRELDHLSQFTSKDRSMMRVGPPAVLTPEELIADTPLQTLLDEAPRSPIEDMQSCDFAPAGVVRIENSTSLLGKSTNTVIYSKALSDRFNVITNKSIDQAKKTIGLPTHAESVDHVQHIKDLEKLRLSDPGRMIKAKKAGDMTTVDLIDTIYKFDQIWTDDYDGTLTFEKIYHTPDGKLDVNKYYELGDILTLMNIDIVIIKSLLGHPQHICTGKGYNFKYVKEYIRERIDVIADELGMTERMPDGALKTMLDDTRGVFFAISDGNGARTEELNRREILVNKVIPLSAWEGLAEHADLLRRSTQQWRKDQIAAIKNLSGVKSYDKENDPYQIPADRTPFDKDAEPDKTPLTINTYLTAEISPEFTKEELEHLRLVQAAIEDFALFEEDKNIKTNLVIDFNAIFENKDGLGDEWESITGVRITSLKTFVEAFHILSKNWDINSYANDANGTIYVDVNPPDVHKGLSARWAKRAAQFHAKHDIHYSRKPEARVPEFRRMAMADGDIIYVKNDWQLLHEGNRGAVVNSKSERYQLPDSTGYPVYLADILGIKDALLQAYTYLYDTTLMSCPHNLGVEIEKSIYKLNRRHVQDMHKAQAKLKRKLAKMNTVDKMKK